MRNANANNKNVLYIQKKYMFISPRVCRSLIHILSMPYSHVHFPKKSIFYLKNVLNHKSDLAIYSTFTLYYANVFFLFFIFFVFILSVSFGSFAGSSLTLMPDVWMSLWSSRRCVRILTVETHDDDVDELEKYGEWKQPKISIEV